MSIPCLDPFDLPNYANPNCYLQGQTKGSLEDKPKPNPFGCLSPAFGLFQITPCVMKDNGEGQEKSEPGEGTELGSFIKANWSKGSFKSAWDNAMHHLEQNAKQLGKDIYEYTADALKFLASGRKVKVDFVKIGDGTIGVAYKGPGSEYGVFTLDGRVLTYHYP